MDKRMTTTDKALAWVGLAFGGGLSVAGNLRAAQLPTIGETDVATWRALPTIEPSMTSMVAAVAVPFAAVLLVEMLNRWTFLPNAVRRGAIGTVALIAALASWVHLFTVMLHEGNPWPIAAAVPLIPDTIAIVSAMALLSSARPVVQPDTTPDMPAPDIEPDTLEPTWTQADTGHVPFRPDTEPDTLIVPDMDTLPDAPADIVVPVQRRTRAAADAAWKVRAREIMAADPALSYADVAGKILAELPDTWSTAEAGRKAVSRLV